MRIPDKSEGLSVDCNGIQLVSADTFVALIVVNEDDVSFVSKLVACKIDYSTFDVSCEVLLEVEEWVTAFVRISKDLYYLGTSVGEVVRVTAEEIAAEEVFARAVTDFSYSEEDGLFAISANGACSKLDRGNWKRIGDFGHENSLFGIIKTRSELAVCGQSGLLAKRLGEEWQIFDRVTNLQYNCILDTENGVIVGGNRGIAFHVEAEEFSQLDGASGNIHGITKFRDKYYLAAGSSSVVLVNVISKELTTVFDGIKPFGIASNEDVLIAYTGLEFAIFNGAKWFV